MPIIGIQASSITGNLTTESFFSIQTVSVTSGSSNVITFSNIPQTYTHLQVRGVGKSSYTDGFDACSIWFNGDTSANYAAHQYSVAGSNTPNSYSEVNIVPGYPMYSFFIGGGGNTFAGGGVCDILDYRNTNKFKTTRAFSGNTIWNDTARIYIQSSLWYSTNAITSISVKPFNGSFVNYSHFALYGIK